MKRIIVLGATGRIGRLLLPLLKNQGNEVTAYVRNKNNITEEYFKMLRATFGNTP